MLSKAELRGYHGDIYQFNVEGDTNNIKGYLEKLETLGLITIVAIDDYFNYLVDDEFDCSECWYEDFTVFLQVKQCLTLYMIEGLLGKYERTFRDINDWLDRMNDD